MATIKSYTSIEQSKMLAEILPLESADMVWANDNDVIVVPSEVVARENVLHDFVPCWSLAALLGILPQINEWITPYGYKNDKLFQFDPKICKIWEHSIIPSYKVTYGNELSTDIYDNPVDAAVEMIIKLKGNNLL